MRALTADVWHIGDVVRKLREARGWTQGELARHADVRPATIGDLEKNKVNTDRETLRKVATALEVRVEFILSQVPVPPPQDETPPPTLTSDEAALLEAFRALETGDDRAAVMHIIRGMKGAGHEGARGKPREGANDTSAYTPETRRAER